MGVHSHLSKLREACWQKLGVFNTFAGHLIILHTAQFHGFKSILRRLYNAAKSTFD